MDINMDISTVNVDLNVVVKQSFHNTNFITEIPSNIRHLADENTVQLIVDSDGACATNAAAAHIFKNQKLGPDLNIIKNIHITDHWQFYGMKISFPFERKVGVKGDKVKFVDGEEEKFLEFMRSEKSAFLWSDSVDLQALCNMYQMRIKIIRTAGEHDENPRVYWIGPDEKMNNHKMIPDGVIPDMTLINYNDKHFNLIIPEENKICQVDQITLNRLETLASEVNESQEKIQNLQQEIADLRMKFGNREATTQKLSNESTAQSNFFSQNVVKETSTFLCDIY